MQMPMRTHGHILFNCVHWEFCISTGRSGTPASKSNLDRRCLLHTCRREIRRLAEAFKCGFCMRYIHENCATTTAPLDEWDHIRKAKSTFWAGEECRPSIIKNKKALNMTSIEGQIEARIAVHTDALAKSETEKLEYTTNYNNKLLIDYQALKRKMELMADTSQFTVEREALQGEIIDLKDAIAVKDDTINNFKPEQQKQKDRIRALKLTELEN